MNAIVIGSGPSGLMAALSLAKEDIDVIIIDSNEKVGKKLLITGNGKCNYTKLLPVNDFLKGVVRNANFLKTALYHFSSQDAIDFFASLGVESIVEENNRVYPKSLKAQTIVNALVNECQKYNVKFLLNNKVSKVYKEDNKFVVEVPHNAFVADKLVLACGGKSYPSTGSTGNGYIFAKEFGHTIIPIRSSLCDIYLKDKFLEKLDGLTFDGIGFKVIGKNFSKSLNGSIKFYKDRISGHVVKNMSSYINREEITSMELDFKVGVNEEELDKLLVQKFMANSNREISRTLTAFVPYLISSAILSELHIKGDLPCNAITKEMRKGFIKYLKHFPLTFLKLAPIEEAIVTSGGIDTKEINPKNMESKLVSNLYIVGEMVDVDALIGGYSIQIALAMGNLLK